MTMIGGFGGVKIEIEGVGSAVFSGDTAMGRFVPKQLYVERETVNHKYIRRHDGFGGTIELQLMNIQADDYLQFVEMYSLYNYSCVNEVPVVVYPTWEVGLVNCPGYLCWFDGELDPQALKRYEAGQTMTVKMKLAQPIDAVPTYINQTVATVIKTRSDEIIVTRNDEPIAIR